MIANWNALVKPEDEVYHLGDFAFMKWNALSVLGHRLNGQIHLILGNHDQEIWAHRDEFTPFESLQHYKELNVAGHKIVLFHYGQRVWNGSGRSSIMLYGHSHGTLPPHGKSVDVGVDCTEIIKGPKTPSDYRPIHLDEILKYMAGRETVKSDYHGAKEDET